MDLQLNNMKFAPELLIGQPKLYLPSLQVVVLAFLPLLAQMWIPLLLLDIELVDMQPIRLMALKLAFKPWEMLGNIVKDKFGNPLQRQSTQGQGKDKRWEQQ